MSLNNPKQINLDASNLMIVYRHYKVYILPVAIILVSFIILFFIVIPQVQQFLLSQNILQTETQKLQVLKNNYNFLSALDDSQSDANLNFLSLALPANKDFVGILGAISTAASNAGVSVGDFSFSLGNLSAAYGAGSALYPSIKIEANFGGTPQNIVKFVSELYKTSPVSEVTKINYGSNNGDLILLFYYKPFAPQNVDDQSPVSPYSASDLSLIKKISLWNNSSSAPFLSFFPSVSSSASGVTTSNASSSAGTNPNPFQ